MTKFISNVNKYLSEMKIKQSYLSMVTGIDKNKMSRLLTGSQEDCTWTWEKYWIFFERIYEHFTGRKFFNE